MDHQLIRREIHYPQGTIVPKNYSIDIERSKEDDIKINA